MAEVEEVTIFIEELGRLFNEYKKCENESIRLQIIKDIHLLAEAIDPENDDRDYFI
ncbi:hypothetical protein M3182_09620 [Mesobacillus maritimus]|uniref:hypothetical protein n=1 Tax=Mesobacillus maritimus TaxID=1643336 RepID=UPI00203B3BA6|nr:hypothetical protein [Mesobacillus maritimus]MCM3585983.1 hypothetical protein [Mesobacillus maritimus]MCM3670356.1 hypothetical protein [Mesobacillus maritimus]